MYVCICNGHSDRDIRAAAETGMTCARAIYTHLGKPPRCGRCLELASKLVEEVHTRRECACLDNGYPCLESAEPLGENAA